MDVGNPVLARAFADDNSGSRGFGCLGDLFVATPKTETEDHMISAWVTAMLEKLLP